MDTCQPPIYHTSKHVKIQQETEQMFPKLLLPPSWLSEVQKRHGEQSKTQQVNKTCKRNRKYEQHLHYLHHMYCFSLLNMALSKRLLEQNGQFTDVRTEQSVHDLMNYLYPNCQEHSGTNHNKRLIEDTAAPSLVGGNVQKRHHKDSKIFRILEENKKMLKQQKDKNVERAETRKCNTAAFSQHEIISMPLTLEDVAVHNPVVEAKPLSTYWTNYVNKRLHDQQ
ncbi:uncharacterized protein LOC133384439 [Rhineura floridana]|uniref:uncharacterized protein LOC133384439 n=1 Tax=Rhineura floridana TaxID=261503 RepID=UPI002AC81AF4|nr:uncharacterized protein LOC133384439 [Rhineura floridana]